MSPPRLVAALPQPLTSVATWRELRDNAAARLAAVGFDTADTQARRLVEEASGYEGVQYHDVLERSPTRRGAATLEAMLVRRLAGEPLQYVLGRWGFRGLDLMVNEAVLIPRPETELLADLAVRELSERHGGAGMAVDLGCGSGAVGLAVDLGCGSGAVGLAVAAECPQAQVVLSDVSPAALVVARANLAGLGMAAAGVRVFEGSWYDALPEALAGTVNVLACNPPYVCDTEVLPPEVADWEPRLALRGGPDGLDGARCVLAGASRWLADGGTLLLELSPQQMDAARGLACDAGLIPEAVHTDLSGRDRVLQCRNRAAP